MADERDTLLTLPDKTAPLLPNEAPSFASPVEGGIFSERYRIERLLGQGGFGLVWLVEDLNTGARAALKLMREDSPPSSRKAFEQEIWALAALEHPGIVRLLDEGTDAGRRFCVLELVEGGELDLRGQRLDVVLQIFDRVLAALAHTHARGVIHRDLKPPNIHIHGEISDRDPKLLDFGIAYIGELLAARVGLNRVDISGVSVEYSSPEQFAGEGVGPATDLYSIGIMLYEALAGNLPFKGPDVTAFFLQHLAHPPPPLDLGPSLAPLEALVMDLLAKSYNTRPESAADVRARISAILDALTEPMPVTPGGTPSPTTATISDPRPSEATIAIGETITLEEGGITEVSTARGADRPWRVRRARSIPLAGRDEECDQLRARLRQLTRTPDAECAVLIGPTGTGRRRIARWLAEHAHEEGLARVLRLDLEAWPDLATALRRALFELLRFPTQQPDPLKKRIAATLPGLGAEALDTKALIDFMLARATPAEPTDQTRLWSRVCAQLAVRPPARPLLLWLDGTSAGVEPEVAAWLASLLESAKTTHWPLMVTMPASPLDTSAPLTALLAHPQVSRVTLGPLTRAESRRLVNYLEPRFAPEAADFLIENSQGLPALIREQLDTWHTSGALEDTKEGLSPTSEARERAATSVESLLKARLEVLLTEAEHPAALSSALWHLALLGPVFSRQQAAWALKDTATTPEMLILRRLVFPRNTRPDAPLAFADASLKALLLDAAQAKIPLSDLTPACIELRLMASLDALIVSDWDLAISELNEGHRLLRDYPSVRSPALALLLQDALARVAYRKRDLASLDIVCASMEARAKLAIGPLAGRLRLAAGLWRGCEAIASQDHEQATSLLDAVCLAKGDREPFFTAQAWSFRGMLALKDLAYARAGHLLGHAVDALTLASAEAAGAYERRLLRLTHADALRDLGEYHGRKSEWARQEDALEEALAIFQEEGDVQGECRALVVATRMCRQRFEEALRQGRTLEPALLDRAHARLDLLDRLMSTLDDHFGHALAAWEAAGLARVEGASERAELYYLSAAEHFQACHARFEAALVDNALGELASRDKRHRDAMGHYERFQGHMKEMGLDHNEAIALNSMGWMALHLGLHDEARSHFEQAASRLKASGIDMAPRVDLAACQIGLASAALMGHADWHESAVALKKAVEFTQGDPIDDAEAQSALERIRAGLGALSAIPAKTIGHYLDTLQR